MASRKTTVNLSEENWKKIQRLVKETGLTQSDLINQAVSGIPVIYLGNQKSLAESFFEIRRALSSNKLERVKSEVEDACRLLNSLMGKIGELMLSSEE